MLFSLAIGSQQHGLKHVHHLHAAQQSGVVLAMLLDSVTGVYYYHLKFVNSIRILLLYTGLFWRLIRHCVCCTPFYNCSMCSNFSIQLVVIAAMLPYLTQCFIVVAHVTRYGHTHAGMARTY
jgi:hypothetical protein